MADAAKTYEELTADLTAARNALRDIEIALTSQSGYDFESRFNVIAAQKVLTGFKSARKATRKARAEAK